MVNKKIIIGAALIFSLTLQVGCSMKDSQKNSNSSKAASQVVAEVSTDSQKDNQEDNQKDIMDEFSKLVENDTKLLKIFEFIDNNISFLSKTNASIMINELEEMQKKNLSVLEQKINTVNINDIYNSSFNLDKIDNIEDKELKEVLIETRDTGYGIETAEGMYFPIINYEFLKKYSIYVTPDYKEYIDIMAVESNKVPAKDAGLVIGWDEVIKRALDQEKFINQYPESIKVNDIKQLYKKYTSFIFFGLNNTPLFSYNSNTIVDDAKDIYIKAAESDEKSQLLENLQSFLDILKKNNYILTDEVDNFRKTTSENM